MASVQGPLSRVSGREIMSKLYGSIGNSVDFRQQRKRAIETAER
jgi:hypothetical protein